MSTTVEMHIGTKFGADDYSYSFGNVRVAGKASYHASNIAQCSIDNLPSTDIPASMKKYILMNCANLIISLARISIWVCGEKPRSDFYTDPKYYETFAENSTHLLSNVTNVLELTNKVANSHNGSAYLSDVERETWNAIRLTCMIAAKLGETDLEPYILEQIES